MLLEASRACDDKPAAHVDSVDLLVVDVESSLGELLLPGIKALQVAFIITHKAASQHNPLIHSFTHAFTTCLASKSGTHNSKSLTVGTSVSTVSVPTHLQHSLLAW